MGNFFNNHHLIKNMKILKSCKLSALVTKTELPLLYSKHVDIPKYTKIS